MPRINDLKKTVFYEMLNMAGRVFILVRYSDNVIIGDRGFTLDEKGNGIVLVFNQDMNFSWDEAGVTASLVFGSSPQKCFIPAEDIVMIYSPELNSQFLTALKQSEEGPLKDNEGGSLTKEGEKIVRIDFSKKKQKHDNEF